MTVKPNDIIESVRNGRTKKLAVLGVTGCVATGIELRDVRMEGSVRIICGSEMWAHPEKVEYCFMNNGAEIDFLRTMSDDEARALRDAVGAVIVISRAADADDADGADGAVGADGADGAYEQALALAEEQAKELIRAKAQADTYRDLYESLLAKVIERGAAL